MRDPKRPTIFYYIKEITPKGDIYKIGITWFNESLSIRDNINRRFTEFNQEIENGLKYQLIDAQIMPRDEAKAKEHKIKKKYKRLQYRGDQTVIRHFTEMFIVDVLKLDPTPNRYLYRTTELTLELRVLLLEHERTTIEQLGLK